MDNPDKHIGEYERLIAAAAWKFSGAAEFDDLYQEGMIAVWLCPPDSDPQYVSAAIFNRLKNWVRFTIRLRHYQPVNYEEDVDGIHK